jgi:hypothetical protein
MLKLSRSIALFILFLHAVAHCAFGQSNGNRTDSYPIGVKAINDTSFVVFGSSNQLAASSMGCVALHNSVGNMVWSTIIGDTLNDYIKNIITKDTSTYYVGRSWVYGQDDPDFWVGKINSHGNEVWTKTYGSASYDQGESIFHDGSSALYIGGTTNSFGVSTQSILLLKTQTNGSVDWGKLYGGNGIDDIKSVKKFNNGHTIIIGKTTSSNLGGEDGLMISIDSVGNIEWTRSYGGADDEEFREVIVHNGYYYCVGHTQSFGFGDKDVWVTKIDYNGNWIWSKIIGDWLIEKGTTIAVHSDKIIIGGYKQSTSGSFDDMLYISLNENGSMNYNRSIRLENQEFISFSASTLTGQHFLGGPVLNSTWSVQLYQLDSTSMVCDSIENSLDIGNATITALPLFWAAQDVTNQINTQHHSNMVEAIDSLVIPLNICYKIEEINDTNIVDTLAINDHSLDNDIVIFPNPTNGRFTINMKGNRKGELALIDLHGNIIVEKQWIGETPLISTLCKGTYLIRVRTENTIITKKIVVL